MSRPRRMYGNLRTFRTCVVPARALSRRSAQIRRCNEERLARNRATGRRLTRRAEDVAKLSPMASVGGHWWDEADKNPVLQARESRALLRGAGALRRVQQDHLYDGLSFAYFLIAVVALVRQARALGEVLRSCERDTPPRRLTPSIRAFAPRAARATASAPRRRLPSSHPARVWGGFLTLFRSCFFRRCSSRASSCACPSSGGPPRRCSTCSTSRSPRVRGECELRCLLEKPLCDPILFPFSALRGVRHPPGGGAPAPGRVAARAAGPPRPPVLFNLLAACSVLGRDLPRRPLAAHLRPAPGVCGGERGCVQRPGVRVAVPGGGGGRAARAPRLLPLHRPRQHRRRLGIPPLRRPAVLHAARLPHRVERAAQEAARGGARDTCLHRLLHGARLPRRLRRVPHALRHAAGRPLAPHPQVRNTPLLQSFFKTSPFFFPSAAGTTARWRSSPPPWCCTFCASCRPSGRVRTHPWRARPRRSRSSPPASSRGSPPCRSPSSTKTRCDGSDTKAGVEKFSCCAIDEPLAVICQPTRATDAR